MYDLRANGLDNPLGLDHTDVRLTWRHHPTDEVGAGGSIRLVESGLEQEFTIPIAPHQRDAKVPADRLMPGRSYRWTVEIGSGPAATSTFELALNVESWSASWIAASAAPVSGPDGEPFEVPADRLPRSWRTMYSAPPVQFRRTVELDARPDRARLAISARGIYRASINGRPVGDDELAPGWSDYPTRIEYRVHDVTDHLREGTNVLTVVVAEGWWAGYTGYDTRQQSRLYGDRPELIAQLDAWGDGGHVQLVTDEQWRSSTGRIRVADLLMGEYHDPAFDTSGWETAPYDDSAWALAEVADRDTSILCGISAPPVRAVATVEPVEITRRGDRTLIDFGQNLVGRLRLRLRGQSAGTVVQLRHAEMLSADGEIYTENLRSAEARDLYICAGEVDEQFEPRFTLHGFRYVELSGAQGEIEAADVRAVVLASDLQPTGTFSTGSELVNQLHSNIVWGQRGNYVSVPTDCPQRDERLGWTADTQVFLRTAAFNADVGPFLQRWLDDLYSAQDSSGRVPDVAPRIPGNRQFDEAAPGWGDAAVIVPWELYREYGDRGLLEANYPAMQNWVRWVSEHNGGGLWKSSLGNNYGDWLSVDEHTPHALVAAAYQIHSLDLVAQSAAVLGRAADEARYRDEARALRALFEAEFVEADGRLRGDTQSGYLFALAWNLVSAERRDALGRRLVEKIESRGARLTSGFLGISLLCPVLTSIGRADLAVDLVLQTAYPSWGYSIRHGATTIWERWDGWTDDGGFQDVRMNSFNHYSLGSVGEWLYRAVGGVDQADDSVAYRRLRIRPVFDARLSPVDATFESPHGLVRVSWQLVGDSGTLAVEVPPGAEAEITLPDRTVSVAAGAHSYTFTRPDAS
ncbi:family 78 glycoside hydrolase catalytic domain [Herbiconiux sp. A18JL235]|uniref:alpha-L-rhamnosidase n=1 Tax=Herbiconiux sp. A18JL235 TaxID=3152363 RepID=A0AB39BDM4_9MICO